MDEKKEESRTPLAEQFRKELDAQIARVKPVMDRLITQIYDIDRDMHNAKNSGQVSLYNALTVEKRAVGALWVQYYEAIQSMNRDYLLALRIDERPTQIKQTVDEKLQEAVKDLIDKNAKMIASLYGVKGHEAMYGACSRPPGTD